MKKFAIALSLCLAALSCSSGNDVVSITDFGIAPDSGENALQAIADAVESCRESGASTLVFPKGRYDIRPVEGMERIGFVLERMKDFTFDGCGSVFVFHDSMNICDVDSCSNVTLKNFAVDWERPFASQMTVVEAAPNHIDLSIDGSKYPYVIEDSKLYFTGENWKIRAGENSFYNMFDKDSKELLYNTWESPMGDIFGAPATVLPDGNVRLTGRIGMSGDYSRLPEPGTYVVMYPTREKLGNYRGITISNGKDITLKDVTLHHSMCFGVLGIRTENITMDNFCCAPNEAEGRVFSLIADASHFNCCKGTIIVQNCSHVGQGDDFINVHGRNARIDEIIDSRTVKVRSEAAMMQPGDTVWVVDRVTAQRGQTLIVAESGADNILSFTSDLPEGTEVYDVIENKTWTAGLIMRNSRIEKCNRARGMLVTTPKEVIIENNYFHSAGTAILIEGDTDVWFESGACANVEIRNNVFDNCLTSGNRDGNRWQWGEAVITITPSHNPSDSTVTPYHHGIRIHDNTFKVFDRPLLHARSVGELTFTGNEIIKTHDYAPYAWQKQSFFLEGCRNVEVSGNKWDDDYFPRDARTVHMGKSDLKTDELTIVPDIL